MSWTRHDITTIRCRRLSYSQVMPLSMRDLLIQSQVQKVMFYQDQFEVLYVEQPLAKGPVCVDLRSEHKTVMTTPRKFYSLVHTIRMGAFARYLRKATHPFHHFEYPSPISVYVHFSLRESMKTGSIYPSMHDH